jgi:hypothetical protein
LRLPVIGQSPSCVKFRIAGVAAGGAQTVVVVDVKL